MFYIPQWVASVFSSLKGVFSMKRKLISLFLVYALGVTSSEMQLLTKAKEWYFAPPAPPSGAALLLMDSLGVSSNEWKIDHVAGSDLPAIKRGAVTINPGWLYADVFVNNSKCNGQFTFSDLKGINKAASQCVRTLSARAMDTSVKREGIVFYKETSR